MNLFRKITFAVALVTADGKVLIWMLTPLMFEAMPPFAPSSLAVWSAYPAFC